MSGVDCASPTGSGLSEGDSEQGGEVEAPGTDDGEASGGEASGGRDSNGWDRVFLGVVEKFGTKRGYTAILQKLELVDWVAMDLKASERVELEKRLSGVAAGRPYPRTTRQTLDRSGVVAADVVLLGEASGPVLDVEVPDASEGGGDAVVSGVDCASLQGSGLY